MCGICVAISKDGVADVGLLRDMCSAIVHRGPDSGGDHCHEQVGIGMRRLRVIDLESGDQPIFNGDRSLAIVFNGEIYNYRELRKDLEARGHRFETSSDTEVVVHLYEEKGPAAVHDLNGMFGFAIHELKTGKVFMARDRLGIKPLYYMETPSGFYAASEIKSLLKVPDVNRAIDKQALDEYFSLLYVPAPRSIFRDIRKLPPGHTLTKQPGRDATIERYWRLHSVPQTGRTEADLIDEFRERFDRAVAMQLVADVPLGVFLSGGIDSGAMVASMVRTGADVRTLSLGFSAEYQHYDEREPARLIAERYGTQHEELVVEPNLGDTMETLAATFDEPLADHGAVPNYLICRAAKREVTVALSGLGGDELSAGYERHLGMKLAEAFRRVPAFAREKLLAPLVNAIPEPANGSLRVDRAKRFVRDASLPWLDRYYGFSCGIDGDTRRRLYSPALAADIQFDTAKAVLQRFADEQVDADFINKILCIDLQAYMVDDLLAVADRVSMAASLEVRVPYIDHTLVEFMATVPGDMKLRGLTKKSFLRKAFQPDLPDEILNKRKTGFAMPVVRWLRDDLKAMLEDVVSPERIRRDGLFDVDTIERLKQEHYSMRFDRSKILWALLMYHNWSDKYAA